MSQRGLQPLPVADAVCSPGRRLIYPELNDELHWATEVNDAVLSRSTRVNFGVALHQQDIMPVRSTGVLDGTEIARRLGEFIGPQRLPFDRMWFEGTWPGTIRGWVKGAQDVAVSASTQMRE